MTPFRDEKGIVSPEVCAVAMQRDSAAERRADGPWNGIAMAASVGAVLRTGKDGRDEAQPSRGTFQKSHHTGRRGASIAEGSLDLDRGCGV